MFTQKKKHQYLSPCSSMCVYVCVCVCVCVCVLISDVIKQGPLLFSRKKYFPKQIITEESWASTEGLAYLRC